MNRPSLAIHGGAGTILKAHMSGELEAEYRRHLSDALLAGWQILDAGGAAADGVEAAVVVLEDCPLFNAGRGAVFTHSGENEMDACLMDGSTQRAGAIAFVKNVKNPIKLARLVIERTEHVLLAGEGANRFAREMKVPMEADDYFFTDFRYQQLLQAREKNLVELDHTPSETELLEESSTSRPMGTVGAVSCDSLGNLAAATSTGGMTNKKFGRIGDSPIVGLGTYADNATCAVSCTGHGEFFMLAVAAYDVAARMKYGSLDVARAASATVEALRTIGGEGGLIAVDAAGRVAMPFNSTGMYRGSIEGGRPKVEIYS
jgi:L-asparaginase / beta-aspartyl-peptidase